MTSDEISVVVKERIDKVLEEANKEFGKEWVIALDGCYDSIDVIIEKRVKPIEDYSKEELLEMIKKTLFDINRIAQSYNTVRGKLHDPEYSKENIEKLKEINFDHSLISARNYIYGLSINFSDLYDSLLEFDDEWVRALRSIDTIEVDPTSFFD